MEGLGVGGHTDPNDADTILCSAVAPRERGDLTNPVQSLRSRGAQTLKAQGPLRPSGHWP